MNFVYKWVGCKLLIVLVVCSQIPLYMRSNCVFFFKIKVCVAGSKHAKKN